MPRMAVTNNKKLNNIMENTNNFAFDFLDYYHIHKDIITNRNFKILDALLSNNLLISRTKKTPKKELAIGDMYFVPECGNNSNSEIEKSWKDHCGEIACYLGDDEWHFIKLRNGMIFFIAEEEKLFIYNDLLWKNLI